MGKNIGKTGMGGAGKLKEEGQTKKKKVGTIQRTEGRMSQRSSFIPSSTTCRRLTVNPCSQHEEGTAPPARASQN